MPSATKLEKAAKFTATSPVTGRTYTRKSQHLYTHACISFQRADAQAARLQQDAMRRDESAAESREIAAHLRAGTTPAAGSVLLERCTAMSYNMQKAGVRTKWDAVLYDTRRVPYGATEPKAPEVCAAEYEGWAADDDTRAAQDRAEAHRIVVANEIREGATFHHSATLAAKEAAKQATYPGRWETRVVETAMA